MLNGIFSLVFHTLPEKLDLYEWEKKEKSYEWGRKEKKRKISIQMSQIYVILAVPHGLNGNLTCYKAEFKMYWKEKDEKDSTR